ncbi:MAG TPA: prepilin-type N-terminal cleavage/methylation domain-containing protein [Gemmatimonadaceae bacterium]|nr:prepilin-type N-terminal cleavage/methylation domain-containing protein [Gemmatimonadaceae bacterium]
MNRESQRGFTLIEVVVAIVILAAGALALAGSAAVTVRRMSDTARRSSGVTMARSRAEASMASACGSLASGSETARGVRSDWVVSAGAVSAELSQRVSYPTSRGARSDDFLTAAPCP